MTLSTGNIELRWGKESTYATAPTNVRRRFGVNESITLDRDAGIKGQQNLGQRTVNTFSFNSLRTSISIDCILSTPWFWGLAFGGTTGTPASGVYPHTYTRTETARSFTLNYNVKASKSGGTDYMEQYRGCTVQSIGISCTAGDDVNVRISAESGNFDKQTYNYSANTDDPDFAAAAISDSFPYTFVGGALTVAGSTVAEVTSADLTMNVAQPSIYVLGKRTANSAYAGEMRYDGRFTASLLSSTRFDNLLTVGTVGDLKLLFDNGKTGGALRSQGITISDIVISKLNTQNSGTNHLVTDASFMGKEATIVVNAKSSSILE